MSGILISRRRSNEFGRLWEVPIAEAAGITARVGAMRDGRALLQRFEFDPARWTLAEAKRWADEHWNWRPDMPGTLTQLCEARGFSHKGKVDAATGLIEDVKIIGLESSNGRTYTASSLERAVPLYEGAPVNLNHPKKPGQNRDIQDRIGLIESVRYVPGDGLRGNLRLNPHLPSTSAIAWFAQHQPSGIGLSHVADGVCSGKAGKLLVEEIKKVKSVDLVTNPATTRGLYESTDYPSIIGTADADGTFAAAMLRRYIECVSMAADYLTVGKEEELLSLARGVMYSLASDVRRLRRYLPAGKTMAESVAEVLSDEHHDAAKLQRITALLESGEGNTEMELKDLTLDLLEQHRPDLLTQLKAKDDQASRITALEEQAKDATRKLDEANAKLAVAARKEKVEKLLVEAKLPDHLVTETFRQQLIEAKDDAALTTLIEDRRAIAQNSRIKAPKSGEQRPGNTSALPDAKGFAKGFRSGAPVGAGA